MIPTPAKVLAAEEIVDRWYDLVPREGKAKDKDNVAGKVPTTLSVSARFLSINRTAAAPTILLQHHDRDTAPFSYG